MTLPPAPNPLRGGIFLVAVAAFTATAAPAEPAAGASLTEQREAFRSAYTEAERGNWDPASAYARVLDDYPLWPDLRAAYLRTTIPAGATAEILEFLEQHPSLRVSRDLRYRLALELGETGRFSEFMSLYEQYYRDMRVVPLDCLALRAAIAKDGAAIQAPRAIEIWLSGSNQPDECDPLFAALRQAGLLGPELYRQRYLLAVEAREFRLARYLARSVDDEHLEEANRWLVAHADASQFLADADPAITATRYREQLLYAVGRLAIVDPDQAASRLDTLSSTFKLPDAGSLLALRDIALWSARNNAPAARDRLDRLPPPAVDAEVLRWRTRTALRAGNWTAVVAAIDGLGGIGDDADEWQYWKAVALQQLDRETEALPILRRLSARRGYYGFLAADRLDIDYSYGHAPLLADEAILAKLSSNHALVRARELFYVGLEGLGRSEWDAEMGQLGEDEQLQAAILAGRWGWHSRAISTAAKVDRLDDLVLRYPLPYREEFGTGSAAAGIAESWVYGVARSESLFMRDIRSGAGAIGIMQVLPETGRRIAAELQQPYAGWDTLVDPQANIRFGTHYLASMYTRFSGHRVLATAAYNAGPLRVEEWLPRQRSIDARIWVETIPFDETRRYVRRVLESATIFHWRLTGETQRIARHLDEIAVPPVTEAANGDSLR
ncbi:MAG: transglycosylase SLT domain-containing protein [Gammaproteobacteria bacterium]|nr:transglycosylase SLT domain-containing protein [Gammaproteobacteria bacterium]MDH4253238.1 transglycosylase SLT domain-containing protein [Gammaproteobacteria bacterium]MDH5308983.1 transglycosylase SLT domain-containing protein [Gammaproteobacteria bacterium]